MRGQEKLENNWHVYFLRRIDVTSTNKTYVLGRYVFVSIDYNHVRRFLIRHSTPRAKFARRVQEAPPQRQNLEASRQTGRRGALEIGRSGRWSIVEFLWMDLNVIGPTIKRRMYRIFLTYKITIFLANLCAILVFCIEYFKGILYLHRRSQDFC